VDTFSPRVGERRGGAWLRFALALYAPAVALLVIVAAVVKVAGIPGGVFMRDPVQTVDAPFYLGLVSNIGILVWCTGGVIALFAAAMLTGRPGLAEPRRFLLWSGILTLAVMLDDLLILHDKVIPDLSHLPEQGVYFIHLVVAAAYVTRFRRLIFAADRTLLVLATALMGVSLVMDQWHLLFRLTGRMILPENYLLEDGAKFLSQITWMGYLLRRAADAVRATNRAAREPARPDDIAAPQEVAAG
jgi:hypothetical protein